MRQKSAKIWLRTLEIAEKGTLTDTDIKLALKIIKLHQDDLLESFENYKQGKKAWYIQSEKLYQNRLKSYYGKMSMGPKYESTNYGLSVPFLLLLPMSLTA